MPAWFPTGLGAVIAVCVVLLCVVLAVIGQPPGPLLVLGLIGALGVARLC